MIRESVLEVADACSSRQTAEAILLHHPGVNLNKRVELRERVRPRPMMSTRIEVHPVIPRRHLFFQCMGELEGEHAGTELGRVPRDMEPISTMVERAYAWWREAVVPWIKAWDAAEPGSGEDGAMEGRRDVLIVSHGGLIGALLQALRKGTVRLDKGARLTKCMNASITVIEVDSASANGKLTRYSDVSHLTGAMVEENADVQDAPPHA